MWVKAFSLVSPMVDREMAYVQGSRARGKTHWYVSEEMPEVIRAMEKSHQKMASSLAGGASRGQSWN